MLEKSTYYILDAQGQQLSMYEHTAESSVVNYYLAERNIYGSSRLGTTRDTVNMYNPELLPSYGIFGNRNYELSNHLGNVLVVISDHITPLDENTDNEVDGYQVGIYNVTDYSPFGVQLDGRTFDSEKYRRGFQGQEKDDEIKGAGNSVNYIYRMHDPRLGRFFAVDPLQKEFPWNSPYAFSENVVINAIELEGRERWYTFNSFLAAENFRAKLQQYNDKEISYKQLVKYLNDHSISYMDDSARDYVRNQLGKGNTKDELWFNSGDRKAKYITHTGHDISTESFVGVRLVNKAKDGGYDRDESFTISNPDRSYAPMIKPIERPWGDWEGGADPANLGTWSNQEKKAVKATGYVLYVVGQFILEAIQKVSLPILIDPMMPIPEGPIMAVDNGNPNVDNGGNSNTD